MKKYTIIKRITAFVLAASTAVAFSSCTKQGGKKDSAAAATTAVSTTQADDVFRLKDKINILLAAQEHYEYPDSKELCDIADSIKSIKYISYNKDFDNYDIYLTPEAELKEISVTEYIYRYEDYPINYEWYKNGVIDKEVLYNKIVQNDRSADINIDEKIDRAIKCVTDVAEGNINLLKKKNPKFKFNLALYNLNTLTVDYSDQSGCNAFYTPADNAMYMCPPTDDFSYEELKPTVSHELFHMMFNACLSNYDCIYISGCSLDDTTFSGNPLTADFLYELTTEDFSLEVCGDIPYITYFIERQRLDLLSVCTGKDNDYFKNCVTDMGVEKLLNSFEPEFRSANYVYSVLYALDMSCGYNKIFDDEEEMEAFESAASNYAYIGLLKNAYLRLIKSVKTNKLTKNEADSKLKKITDTIPPMANDFSGDNYQECLNKLDNIYKTALAQ